jgi:uncharacterized protein YjgD (DUF1641 family)
MDTTVTNFSTVLELRGMGEAATAALTDAMVERLVTTASNGLEILDRLNDPETRSAVHRLIDGLTILHSTGGLDTLFELATMLQAARSAATDDMIERLYQFLETMVSNLATLEVAELARDVELSLYEGARRCGGPDAPKTLLGLVRCLFKPECVSSLGMLLAFSNVLRQRTQLHSGGGGT